MRSPSRVGRGGRHAANARACIAVDLSAPGGRGMKIEFHDEYFVLVLGVLWLLCFLRPILRFVAWGLAEFGRCLEDGCGCDATCEPCCGVYAQHLVLLGLFVQPGLLVAAALWARGRRESSVWVVRYLQWDGAGGRGPGNATRARGGAMPGGAMPGGAMPGNATPAAGDAVLVQEHLLVEVVVMEEDLI